MIQQSIDLQTLGRDVVRVMDRLPGGSGKIFGSALRRGVEAGDIDVAVAKGDTATMAYLLHQAPSVKMHPIELPVSTFENLHDVLSWKNCLVTADTNGLLTYGSQYAAGNVLEFNPASRRAFPSLQCAVRAAKKLVEQGFALPESEKARATLHLHGNVDMLETIAREALTEKVVWLLAGHGATVAGGFFRDEVDGRCPKDIDVFVPAGHKWEQLCDELGEILEEVKFDKPEGSRVNLRKFRAKSQCPGHEALVVDVIDYSFVHSTAHVVETFDFAQNMLWWDPSSRHGIQGSSQFPASEIVQLIHKRILKVGDNLWYRAGLYRALKRWQRFRRDGYVADAETIAKYSQYVKLMKGD